MPYSGGPNAVHNHALVHHADRFRRKSSPTYDKSHWIRGPPTERDRHQIDQHVLLKETVGVTTAPDGGFGWFIVVCGFFLHVTNCGVMYSLSVYFPVFLADFRLTATTCAWISAAFFGAFFGCGPLASLLVERFETRTTAFFGCLVAFIGLLIASFMPYFALVVVFQGVVTGIGCGCAVLCAVTSVARWFEGHRAIAIGIIASGSGIGAAMMGPLLAHLIERYGWRGAMLIESAIALQGCVFALFLRPVTSLTDSKTPLSAVKPISNADEAPAVPELRKISMNKDEKEKNGSLKPSSAENISLRHVSFSGDRQPDQNSGVSEGQDQKIVQDSPSGRESRDEKRAQAPQDGNPIGSKEGSPDPEGPILKKPSTFHIFKDWVFWVFVVSQFLIFFSLNAPLVYQVNRALVDVKVDRMTSSILVSIMGALSTVGRLFFGFIANKVGALRFWIFSLSMVFVGIATALVTVNDSFVGAAIYAAVAGLGYGCMVCLTSLVLVDSFGVATIASAYGNMVFFRGLGSLAGPPLGGLIVSSYGGRHKELYIVMGCIMTVGGLIITALPLLKKIASASQKPAVR
ncbi:hypothetical protein RvY_15614 [Ramazzottius varieornatus]|uniref:Major facilitator superfamily (MFS) profile domain-containing protein n=1 Tax=Ramazzottius varieornatus TaxID=947166 RepID=A0A1D1W3G0_RAMVA|nr:hypothetical protein RvY_15614 [Ramazzottius varieornatus]